MEDTDSSSDMFSSSVEARLWFLTKSKLIDPLACKGLKSLSISNGTTFGSHGIFDESLDGTEEDMLDGDEAPILDTIGDAMELDPPNFLDPFRENVRDEAVNEGKDSLDDDLFWEHAQEEIEYDSAETLEDNSTSSAHDESYSAF